MSRPPEAARRRGIPDTSDGADHRCNARCGGGTHCSLTYVRVVCGDLPDAGELLWFARTCTGPSYGVDVLRVEPAREAPPWGTMGQRWRANGEPEDWIDSAPWLLYWRYREGE